MFRNQVFKLKTEHFVLNVFDSKLAAVMLPPYNDEAHVKVAKRSKIDRENNHDT